MAVAKDPSAAAAWKRPLGIGFLCFGVVLYIGGLITNVTILGTSEKHANRLCPRSKTMCEQFFTGVWNMGIAGSAMGFANTLLSLALTVKRRNATVAPLELIFCAMVWVFWLATIVVGWASADFAFVIGYFGIPEYEESHGTVYGSNGRTYPSTSWTLVANWNTWPKNRPFTKITGQYHFVAKYIEAMKPAMNNEGHFSSHIKEFAHAKQGTAVLVFNHFIFAFALVAMCMSFRHVVAKRAACASTAHPVTKDGSPRHSSV